MHSSTGITAIKILLALSMEQKKTMNEVAESVGISRDYVDQICRVLRNKGYVDTVRGVHGGIYRSKFSHAVRVSEIVELFDTPRRNYTDPVAAHIESLSVEPLRNTTLADIQKFIDNK